VGYKPHRKQILAHLAFLTQGYKRGVLLMGRQCLDADTLVRTNTGYTPICFLKVGDKVLSYNGEYEYKKVINTWEYDVEPKPMISCTIYGEQVNATYDHPFYFDRQYVPLYQLVWGDMDTSQREKLQLLCEQYGSAFDNESIWFKGSDSGFTLHNQRYSSTEVVVSHIGESQTTFAIDVEDNHNYLITESEILVKNSGKTFFAVNHGWLSAVIKQGRYFVVFKTYKQAHEVVWRQYIPLIPKELIYKKNEADLLIELNYIKGPVKLPDGTIVEVEHDDNMPRSTIQLLGSDQSDSHRGFKADGIIFDEYADQDPNNWDAVYKHFFTTTDGWAVFMGTPRGYNHFYDLIEDAKDNPRWFYLEATWRDSPYVKREFIEEEKKEAERKGTLSTFMQEVELEFRAVQGAVFPAFDRSIHIVKPTECPVDDVTTYACIDFGYHTTACLIVDIDKDQNWYVVDEVYGREEILKDIIPRIKKKLGDKRLVLMVGDSQAKDAIETMSADFPIVPVVKRQDSIVHGINLVRTKLKPRIQLVGPPKPTLFISSVCKNFIQEVEAYKYPEDKKDRNPSEVPMKENDHGPDAIRYLAIHLKYGLVADDKLPKSSVLKEVNQYGLL